MLIRRPVEEVFEAFVNPEVTTKFWFTKSSGRLETEKLVTWDWEMYGVSDQVYVEDLQLNKRILIKSSDSTKTEWVFDSRTNKETFVTIVNSGFKGNEDDIVNQAVDSMGGYTMVLCALKALLEHNVILNAVFDKAPDAHTK
ncbi:SRPBCC family protein [Cytobacillus horneckiae]|uniref:Polyketide cyclase n=1 Tax=Cytobacillus horneckiae TaxID=549687 RepID=A0A2N0ZGC2_9BACI|nr:SRPBCC family protein [Cytobacillus horneckiae]MBN6886132.1 SRPBCC family protein [Cytobacillus horneckiae]MCM3176432.1 SRPBCC family protein [Cytobacillus horneckiae]MEC1155731.1 SRPBCC family protein [Cytobacillus horneckiae]MED2939270.1 SRPBCC family protein [Cytobacillus horneckiae]PKG28562.1 polyketide cyclase [Cytobacillus horneckiae]